MKQLLCNFSSGDVYLAALPVGEALPGKLLVRVHHSVLSMGTERMLVGFARAGWLQRAKSQPQRVAQVLQRVKAQGFFAAYDAVQGRLQTPLALGYACAGEVIGVGEGVEGFRLGDRVACNGSHADVVQVPYRLCAKIPEGVTTGDAAMTTLASIALHGVRLARVELGERVLVLGLGLIGCLTVQVLQASGASVVGVDLDASRRDFARERYGIETLESCDQGGYDAVLVCVASESGEPMQDAISASRKRGRVVMVGTGVMDLDRGAMYEKEVSVQVASSYGPGRYDAGYEEHNLDYPLEYVRWTAQRNFEAVLGLMQRGLLDVSSVVGEECRFEDAPQVYTRVIGEDSSVLSVRFGYDAQEGVSSSVEREKVLLSSGLRYGFGEVVLGVIGAGVYAQRTFLPGFQGIEGVRFEGIVSRRGGDAGWLGLREGFRWASAKANDILDSQEVTLVAVLTRHDTHADYTLKALTSGHSVFVEKPLALNEDELDEVMASARERCESQLLMVGFNRRYAPMTRSLVRALRVERGVKSVVITVNAGALSEDHWLHDRDQGGRIVGEAVHFIDLCRHLVGSEIVNVSVQRVGNDVDAGAWINMGFSCGSVGVVAYLTQGPEDVVKERVEVMVDGKMARIEGWKKLSVWGSWKGGLKSERHLRADKGHRWMYQAMVDHMVRGESMHGEMIPLDELDEVSRVAIRAAKLHQEG